MQKRVFFGILGTVLIFSIISSFTMSTASVQQTVLSDDSPLYDQSEEETSTLQSKNYIADVQPGNYTVVAFRSGPGGCCPETQLYGDAGHTLLVSDTGFRYRDDTVSWDEVCFYTIDGTSLGTVTPYYIRYYNGAIDTQYFWVEMENGFGNGMKDISLNDTVEGSFTADEVIDAYQVYLDADLTYYVALDVPADKTFDLFLCRGVSNEENALRYSHSDNLGADESFTCSVPVSGYYTIIVTNPNWTTGNYSLLVEELIGDSPVYSKTHMTSSSETKTIYSLPIQPGKYGIIGFRGGPGGCCPEVELYSDVSHTTLVSETGFRYRDDTVSWDEVGFFTIDGTSLSTITSYYVNYVKGATDDYLHWVEIENGKNTGMKSLTVNETMDGSINDNEVFDAYQAYLETGNTYNFTLDVPGDKTFDLFLCYGTSNEENALYSSHSDNLGTDETITGFKPDVTGYYCVAVSNPDALQSGSYQLSIQGSTQVGTSETTTTSITTTSEPTTSGTAPFSGLISIIVPFVLIIVVVRKQRRR